MPDYTGNLNLAKPIPNEDSADIRVINENMDKIDEWSTEINKKTKGATSEVAGIVKYGTDVSTALEGSKLAEILGIEYGGVLNNANAKIAGKGYYDTANKKIYKCTTNTSINYADAGYFIEVSNNDLLDKLQNLVKKDTDIITITISVTDHASVVPFVTKYKIGDNLILVTGKIMQTVANKRITLTTNKGEFIGGSASISSTGSGVGCDYGGNIFYFTPAISANTCPFIALIRL